ncbi:MAG: hypothetical protein M0C28_47555 [Candidatus Moduliflexus flocculans]|nr:hypothetical protein [Candidatus Moduliflexus flocculans]
MTESASQALAILRDGSQFQWYVIPLLAFVFYVYTVEVQKRSWDLVLAGLAFWGMDWINEICERPGLPLHRLRPGLGRPRQDRLPHPHRPEHRDHVHVRRLRHHLVEDAPARQEDEDPRPAQPLVHRGRRGRIFCVFVEVLLNGVGALTWDYAWWSRSAPWLIFLFGYLTFFVVAFWVHDMKTLKGKLVDRRDDLGGRRRRRSSSSSPCSAGSET